MRHPPPLGPTSAMPLLMCSVSVIVARCVYIYIYVHMHHATALQIRFQCWHISCYQYSRSCYVPNEKLAGEPSQRPGLLWQSLELDFCTVIPHCKPMVARISSTVAYTEQYREGKTTNNNSHARTCAATSAARLRAVAPGKRSVGIAALRSLHLRAGACFQAGCDD